MSSLKTIIFDLDDTLLKTKQSRYAALKYAGSHFYNFDISDEMLTTYWGLPFSEFMHRLFGDVDTMENILNNYKSIISNFPNQPYEDAREVVEVLGQKFKLGVLSSAAKYLIKHDLISTGFSLSSFHTIQGAEDTRAHKPDPSVFNPSITIFRKMSIEPQEILFTGDTLDDYKAATGAGLQFIGIAGRTTAVNDFDAVGAENVLSLTELKNRIISL